MSTVATILEKGLIAVIDAPIEERLFDWAMAASQGGVGLLGIPVSLNDVTEIASDLADEAGLLVGISDIREPDQLSIAIAAGAQLIMSPIVDWSIIEQAKMRNLTVIAGAFTPSEVHTAFRAGADLVSLHPVGVVGNGEAYFQKVRSSFHGKPLLVSGGISVENAPNYLELGADAAIVDTGVFPTTNDAAAVEVIAMRAAALVEVCAEARGLPSESRISSMPPPPPSSSVSLDVGEPPASAPLDPSAFDKPPAVGGDLEMFDDDIEVEL